MSRHINKISYGDANAPLEEYVTLVQFLSFAIADTLITYAASSLKSGDGSESILMPSGKSLYLSHLATRDVYSFYTDSLGEGYSYHKLAKLWKKELPGCFMYLPISCKNANLLPSPTWLNYAAAKMEPFTAYNVDVMPEAPKLNSEKAEMASAKLWLVQTVLDKEKFSGMIEEINSVYKALDEVSKFFTTYERLTQLGA